MQRHLISSLIAAAFAALMITLQTSGMAQSKYKFVRIADTTGFQGGIQPPVAVNDSGKVVFVGSRSPGVVGVFTGSGGPLTAVADTTRSTTFFGFPSINGPGQATFFANKGVRTGYFAGDDGATTLFESGGAVHGFIGDIFSSPSGSFSTVQLLNSLPGVSQAIVTGDGGHVTTIADTSGLFRTLDLDPNVNRSGQVAFYGSRRDGSEGIFVGKGGHITRIADTFGPLFGFMPSPAINDRGQVLFQASFTDLEGNLLNGLFLSSEGKIRTVLDSAGAYSNFGSQPALNTRGQIAFLGTTQSGIMGIFTGASPQDDRVIAEGDALDGSTVSRFDINSFRTGLNNKGQIVFFVQLADGRTGVYRADPIRPENDDAQGRH